MKNIKFSFALVVLFYISTFAQILKTDYVCLYQLNYEQNDKKKSNEQFILLINNVNKKSFFLSTTIYVSDSLQRANPENFMNYSSEFPELVVTSINTIDVFEDIIDYKYRYTETEKLKWEILKEKKKIAGYNSQLARCNAYGRVWYGWFSKEIPLNFGPYKFNGLPGLIVSAYDSEKKLVFTLEKFKKKVVNHNLPSKKQYSLLTKDKYYKARFKIFTSDDGSRLFKNAEEKKKWFKSVLEMQRKEVLLDIQFPQE